MCGVAGNPKSPEPSLAYLLSKPLCEVDGLLSTVPIGDSSHLSALSSCACAGVIPPAASTSFSTKGDGDTIHVPPRSVSPVGVVCIAFSWARRRRAMGLRIKARMTTIPSSKTTRAYETCEGVSDVPLPCEFGRVDPESGVGMWGRGTGGERRRPAESSTGERRAGAGRPRTIKKSNRDTHKRSDVQ